jgi:hypothetical protein
MRKILVVALVVCFWALASPALAEKAAPSLVGIWTCKTNLHRQTKGFLTGTWKWVVNEQKDHVFHGVLDFTTSDGNLGSVTFSGVISPDNKKIYVIYERDKMSFGDLTSKNSLVMHTLKGGQDHTAVVCTLIRQQ